jgi:hypothetical protein
VPDLWVRYWKDGEAGWNSDPVGVRILTYRDVAAHGHPWPPRHLCILHIANAVGAAPSAIFPLKTIHHAGIPDEIFFFPG